MRELQHVIHHAKRQLTASGVAVREVTVLVRNDGAERRLAETVDESDAEQEHVTGAILATLTTGALFVHPQFRAGGHADLVNWSSANGGGGLACQTPQTWRLCRIQTAPGGIDGHPHKQCLNALDDGQKRAGGEREEQADWQPPNQREAVDDEAGSDDHAVDDER